MQLEHFFFFFECGTTERRQGLELLGGGVSLLCALMKRNVS